VVVSVLVVGAKVLGAKVLASIAAVVVRTTANPKTRLEEPDRLTAEGLVPADPVKTDLALGPALLQIVGPMGSLLVVVGLVAKDSLLVVVGLVAMDFHLVVAGLVAVGFRLVVAGLVAVGFRLVAAEGLLSMGLANKGYLVLADRHSRDSFHPGTDFSVEPQRRGLVSDLFSDLFSECP